jgi:polysaccharide export outer membrane protein
MNRSFGPWSSEINTGTNQQLDTFWRRRMAMLPSLNPSSAFNTRRTASVLGVLALLAVALPTLIWVTRKGTVNNIYRAASGTARTDLPTEMQKGSLAPYRVEPPDILSIEAANNVRLVSDTLRAGDELRIRASNTLPIDPTGDPTQNEFKTINGLYRVQPDGTVDLGPEYGSVIVEGLTVREAKTAVDRHLRDAAQLNDPKVAVSLPNVNGRQVISGEHLIRPDGTVSLGTFGSVFVNGMTLDEVKSAVEGHLAKYIHNPEMQVDVLAYNSKVIYVIFDDAGGESVVRVPFTGNDTVLDVMSQVDGLYEPATNSEMWVARPPARQGPSGGDTAPKMFVDWKGITQEADTTTNYHLFPGDRMYVKGLREGSARSAGKSK